MSRIRQRFVARCVGVDLEAGVDEISKLMPRDRDYDLDQIRNFCWVYKIPHMSRRQVWMALLQAHPASRANDDSVAAIHADEADSLRSCLLTTRELEKFGHFRTKHFSGFTLANDGFGLASTLSQQGSQSEPPTPESEHSPNDVVLLSDEPTAHDLAAMLLLCTGAIFDYPNIRTRHVHSVEIARNMLSVCGGEDWRSAFQLTRGLSTLLSQHFGFDGDYRDIASEIQDVLSQQLTANSAFFESEILSKVPLRKWLLSGGALILKTPRALHKFWDKLVTGEGTRCLMTSLIVEFLFVVQKYYADNIMQLNEAAMSEETEMRLVKLAIDNAQATGARRLKTDFRPRNMSFII